MDFFLSNFIGCEDITQKELKTMGYSKTEPVPGGVFFQGEQEDIARVNLRSRTGNTLYFILEEAEIKTFDELFEFVYAQPRNELDVPGAPVLVTGVSKRSKLASVPTIQSIVQKAIIKKIHGEARRTFNENREPLHIHILLIKNQCIILVNTTGESLYKRGYRKQTGEAPLKETIAASLLLYSSRDRKSDFLDPFCGSGTIVSEALMLATNTPPGISRKFSFEKFPRYNPEILEKEKELAKDKKVIFPGKIYGSDIDESMLDFTKANLKTIPDSQFIQLSQQDFLNIKEFNGQIVTNPPYGKRLEGFNLGPLYHHVETLRQNKANITMLTSYKQSFLYEKGRRKIQIINNGEYCFIRKTL